jgi:hypothetical protein
LDALMVGACLLLMVGACLLLMVGACLLKYASEFLALDQAEPAGSG